VPTGATKAPNPIANVVMRTIRLLVPLNLIALISGVLHVTLAFGIEQVWPAALYAVIYSYVSIPLLFAPRVLSWPDIGERCKVSVLATLNAAAPSLSSMGAAFRPAEAVARRASVKAIVALAVCTTPLLVASATTAVSGPGVDDSIGGPARHVASGQSCTDPALVCPDRRLFALTTPEGARQHPTEPVGSYPSFAEPKYAPETTRNQTQP
jgi:hypothetical protein